MSPIALSDRLTLFRPGPASASRVHTVLICPGGGYGMLADHEAAPVAEWANGLGYAAAILRYRVAPEAGHPNPLSDALDAMRTLRGKASDLGLSGRVAVLGFSAGGHLAASLSVHGAHDDQTRPDASVLVYPVITMGEPNTHLGSRANLLGPSPSDELVAKMSNERQVSSRTPPAFIVHGVDDAAVPVENALMYAGALRAKGIPFELHVFPQGPHGFGMGNDQTPGPIREWPRLAGVWLKGVLG
jgi:acetyl esterase/lipase